MRLTVKFDSLTHQEAHEVVGAFQRTRAIPLPPTLCDKPTIEITGGSHMNITLPPMTYKHLRAVLREYEAWRSTGVLES